MSKKNNPIGYTLGQRKVGIGPNKGKVVIQATPSGRHRMSFERFCELEAKDTTLNYMEVQSVLNLAVDMAREVVANSDIVDFGRLGTLSPSFKSKVVPIGSEFNANVHINVVAPKGDVRDVIAPSECDFVGWPIGIPISWAAEKVSEMLGASCLYQGLSSAVCEESRDKTCGSDVIALALKAIPL